VDAASRIAAAIAARVLEVKGKPKDFGFICTLLAWNADAASIPSPSWDDERGPAHGRSNILFQPRPVRVGLLESRPSRSGLRRIRSSWRAID
jgi:hypothetical protein